MNYSNRDRIPAELEGIEARLREGRVAAAPLELDRIKLRAIQQAERSRASFYSRQKGKLMKSRLALTLVIATGMLMSTGGVTMAVSNGLGCDSAAECEYDTAGNDNDGAVLGTSESGGPSGGQPSQDSGVPSQDEQVATASTDSGTLPFTGFAAIPLLILGLGFVSVGLVLRSRTNRDA